MPRKSKVPFFPTSRTLFESELWLSEPFTAGQAWLDLNYLAAFEKTTYTDGRRTYELKEGQLRTTLGQLARRWKWNKKRTWEQIGIWKRNGLVYAQGDAHGYTLTIENYGFAELYGNAQVYAQVNEQGNAQVTDRGTDREISSINTRIDNKELRRNDLISNSNSEDEDDPRVIRSFIDPKTGEERVVIRP